MSIDCDASDFFDAVDTHPPAPVLRCLATPGGPRIDVPSCHRPAGHTAFHASANGGVWGSLNSLPAPSFHARHAVVVCDALVCDGAPTPVIAYPDSEDAIAYARLLLVAYSHRRYVPAFAYVVDRLDPSDRLGIPDGPLQAEMTL